MNKAIAVYFLSLASLATGAALLVYFLTNLSLLYGVAFTLSIAITVAYASWRVIPFDRRQVIKQRAKIGLLVGFLATAAYDLSRFLLVRFAGLSIWPFETFRLFGQLLIGENGSAATTLLVGTTYHVLNGVGFSLAYTLILGHRGWLTGVIWALVLEMLMVTFYPNWLNLKAYDEFLSVSIFGHVVYGFVLGWSSRKLLARSHPSQERKEHE